MLSYQFYSFLHITSIIIIFISLGGVVTHLMQGGTKSDLKCKKHLGIHHGIALLVALVSGFGMIARMHYSFSENPWLFIKIACWLLLGGFTALVYKKIIPTKLAWWALLTIMFIAVFAVVFKPI